jgi:hypothetical protein
VERDLMAIFCALGRHSVDSRGIRNGKYEFARCQRCSCDLMRSGSDWKRVPRGFKVVWKPKEGAGSAIGPAGMAAIGRQVDLRGVTVVGERSYGSQRFALVVLNAKDQRSYTGMVDQLGTSAQIAGDMENSSLIARASALKPRQAPPRARVSDMLTSDKRDAFGWEKTYVPPKTIAQPQGRRRG